MQSSEFKAIVPSKFSGYRLDYVLANLFPDYSRTQIQHWIKQGQVTVNEYVLTKPKALLNNNDTITMVAMTHASMHWQAEPVSLKIIYQDEHILVLNKARGQVVHPGAGHHNGTLLNGLLHYFPQNALLPRAGIIHRLDKETSGLMVVAKSIAAQNYLVAALQARSIVREYQAVVHGIVNSAGTIDQPIGRHPRRRTKMAIHPLGKPALTHYSVVEKFRAHTHVKLRLGSGRTHQIRVHMNFLGYPIVGDPLYGYRARTPKTIDPQLLQALKPFTYQALHATRLKLLHPVSKQWLQWEISVPQQTDELLRCLRLDSQLS